MVVFRYSILDSQDICKIKEIMLKYLDVFVTLKEIVFKVKYRLTV